MVKRKKKQTPAKAELGKKDEDGLTERQRRFVEEYLVDLNAAAAAQRAGYSPKGSNVQGHRLLTNVDIQVAVNRRKQERSKRTELSADSVLMELARCAFSDAQDYVTVTHDGVTTNPSSRWTEDQSRAVQYISEKLSPFGRQISIKTHDKLKALEMLAKHFKLFEEQPLNVNISWMDLVKSAKAELAAQERRTELEAHDQAEPTE